MSSAASAADIEIASDADFDAELLKRLIQGEEVFDVLQSTVSEYHPSKTLPRSYFFNDGDVDTVKAAARLGSHAAIQVLLFRVVIVVVGAGAGAGRGVIAAIADL